MEDFLCDAALYDDLCLEFTDVWTGECGGELDKYAGVSANKLMTNHGMKVRDEVRTGQGACLGYKVWWFNGCSDGESIKTTEAPIIDGCSVPDHEGFGECDEITYKDNCFVTDGFSFKDADCNSKLAGINMAAIGLNETTKRMRKAIAGHSIDLMLTCVQPNMYPKAKGCPKGNMTELSEAEFDSKLMNHFKVVARKHGCEDFCILDDSNFLEYIMNLEDASCCGDASAKARLARFDYVSDNFLDDYLDRCSTFIVNPKCFGFTNTTCYDNTAPERQPNVGDAEIWTWKMSDPMMQILIIDSATGRQNVRNIEYDVEYKRECCEERGMNGKRQFKHTYHLTYSGGAHKSPLLCGNDSGPCVFEWTNIG